MKDYPGLYESLQRDEFGYKIENMRIVYLFLYNFFQFVGYLYIVGVLTVRYMKDGPGEYSQTKVYYVGNQSMNFVNLLLSSIWCFKFFLLIKSIVAEIFKDTYELIGHVVRYCQLLQFLEIIHPILGFTKTGIFMSVVQVSGRATILFALIHSEERVQSSSAIFFLFYVWSVAELFRYPYYMIQLSKHKVYIVTWLRYSAWVVLYPLGFISEACVIFQ